MIRSYLRRVTLGLAAAWLAGRYWQSSLTLGTGIRSRAAFGDGVRRNSVATIIFLLLPFYLLATHFCLAGTKRPC